MLGNSLLGRIRGTSVAQRRPADARPDSSREKAGGRGRRCAGHGSARHRRHYPDFWPKSVDPRLIVLGGGMAKTGEPLVEVITAELRRRESQCRFLETLDLPARLRLAPVDQPVGAIGAAMAA